MPIVLDSKFVGTHYEDQQSTRQTDRPDKKRTGSQRLTAVDIDSLRRFFTVTTLDPSLRGLNKGSSQVQTMKIDSEILVSERA